MPEHPAAGDRRADGLRHSTYSAWPYGPPLTCR